MARFFVDNKVALGCPLILDGENAQHISRSLRMRRGETVAVCSEGKAYQCRITDFTADTVTVLPEQELPSHEPEVAVSVYLGLPKGDKLDFCVQKCVELGASEIIPFLSDYCVVKADGKNDRTPRRQKIALEAAKQCGRDTVPAVLATMSFQEALGRGAESDIPLFCYEGDAVPLSRVLSGQNWSEKKKISIFIGPEGGFSKNEFDKAREMGYNIVSLGSRVLRCETAPLCALTAVLYAAGEF